MIRHALLLLSLAGFAASATLTPACAADVVWFDGRHPITYSVSKKVDPVVMTAIEMFKSDMRQVTGLTPVASGKASIQVIQQNGSDDGFRISVTRGRIVIEGHSGRGAAYGLLELSRMAGVSPWVWWGDVVPERKELLTISSDFTAEQCPSVRLRGIFLNDEDWSIRPWSSTTYEPGPRGQIGAQTYKRLFQLLLRLRANTIWPAMHEGTVAFFHVPRAKQMADSCGIIIGTSHCEPLLRNNVGEWDVGERGRFNYRTNREAVQQYWSERLREVSQSKDNLFTIGMRGIHDSSMEGYITEQEKFDALQQVIDDQQQLLSRYVGNPSQLPQVFVPYKEVLQLYEKGLRVPDYVTLMWCDDNYGYMTRLSGTEEQRRTGGGGVYYHLSYWGRPHDYLWLTTTQPGLIYSEMKAAYDHQVRQLWIANVHDPKVAAYDLELFMDMAWDIHCVQPATVFRHLERWLCRQFGEAAGMKLAPAMWEFYRLNAIRRPEFMGWTQVELDKRKYPRGLSPVSATELNTREVACRLADFERIRSVVAEVASLVRPELADAYFAAVTYPVMAAAAMNRKLLGDSLQSRHAYEEIQALTRHYNEMAGGKWRGLMDAAPRRLPVFGEARLTVATDTLSDAPLIARHAMQWDEATQGCQPIQMLGYSMNAVSIPKGGELVYRFSTAYEGDATLYTAMIPTHPTGSGDLRYQVTLDDGQPMVCSMREPFRSEQWKRNVLRGQALRQWQVRLGKGRHTLRVKAIDDHIVFDQWMLDAAAHRAFYVIPVP